MEEKIKQAKEKLDAQVREIVQWHFSSETGCPFWLEKAKGFDFDPLKDVQNFEDLRKFGPFEDEWLRGGPVERWVPNGFSGQPVYVVETGGTTGVPKSRIAMNDFRTDYELFSDTLPVEFFPNGLLIKARSQEAIHNVPDIGKIPGLLTGACNRQNFSLHGPEDKIGDYISILSRNFPRTV